CAGRALMRVRGGQERRGYSFPRRGCLIWPRGTVVTGDVEEGGRVEQCCRGAGRGGGRGVRPRLSIGRGSRSSRALPGDRRGRAACRTIQQLPSRSRLAGASDTSVSINNDTVYSFA